MNTGCNTFISWAKDKGWNIIFKSESVLNLDDSIISRYNEIPESYVEFLKIVKQCIAPSEKSWFICEDDYNNLKRLKK